MDERNGADMELAQLEHLRDVLVLTYRFPPIGGGGVQRTTKFLKYLPQFGWRSTVVAPDWSKSGSSRDFDLALFEDVPASTELVLSGPPPLYGEKPLLKAISAVPGGWRLTAKMKRSFAVPDGFCRWIKQARPYVDRAVANRRPTVIYSSCPPMSAHSLAWSTKRRFKIPWIADFRDPWSTNVLMFPDISERRKRFNGNYERQICQAADLVIANTHTNREQLLSQHNLSPERVVTLPNGYDEEDFISAAPDRSLSCFYISYVGSVYSDYTPAPLVDAVAELLRQRPELPIKLRLAGTSCNWAREYIRDSVFKNRVELLGYVPHEQVAAVLASSHLLIQCLPASASYCVPGKMYEYIRSGTPTLAICGKPSEIETLLQRTEAGVSFEHHDVNGIQRFVEQQVTAWQGGANQTVDVESATIRAFDRRSLTQRLADIFDRVAASR